MSHNVSICVANYNMADTIAESLQSILANIPNHYELVIVDESDDDSRRIIDELDVDNQIKKIYVDDLGLSCSRNLAVKKASGDIVITHVDMDDWYDSRYFEPFVELYMEIKNAKGGEDFFFSCENFNITSRGAYLDRYELRDLPIGAGERDYRWRAIMSGEFINVKINENISGRIKLSDRKNMCSRANRTVRLLIGLFQVGYTTRRILNEEIFIGDRPVHSQSFMLVILPYAYIVSIFKTSVGTDIPNHRNSLDEEIEQNTYTIPELTEKYNINRELKICSLVSST